MWQEIARMKYELQCLSFYLRGMYLCRPIGHSPR